MSSSKPGRSSDQFVTAPWFYCPLPAKPGQGYYISIRIQVHVLLLRCLSSKAAAAAAENESVIFVYIASDGTAERADNPSKFSQRGFNQT